MYKTSLNIAELKQKFNILHFQVLFIFQFPQICKFILPNYQNHNFIIFFLDKPLI